MSSSEPRTSFEALRERYAASFATKRRMLAQAWDAFAADNHDAAARRDLSTHLHRLCGSAPAYGYERLGHQARAADRILHESSAEGGDRAAELAQAVAAVLDELALAAAQRSSGQCARGLRVVLVEGDPGQAASHAGQLQGHGCEVRVARSAHALWQTVLTWPCHAIVLDFRAHGAAAADIARRLRGETSFAAIALICIGGEPDAATVHRLRAAGCDAFLGKSEAAGRLFDQLRQHVARADRSGFEFA